VAINPSFNPIPCPSWTFCSFIFILIHPMEPSAIDFTKEIQVCHHCKKKWVDDDTIDHERWNTVQSRTTRQVVSICGACATYYSEKSHSEYCSFCWRFRTPSELLMHLQQHLGLSLHPLAPQVKYSLYRSLLRIPSRELVRVQSNKPTNTD